MNLHVEHWGAGVGLHGATLKIGKHINSINFLIPSCFFTVVLHGGLSRYTETRTTRLPIKMNKGAIFLEETGLCGLIISPVIVGFYLSNQD